MLNKRIETCDPERWLMTSWDQMIGNSRLRTYCQDVVLGVRERGVLSGYNSLIKGPSRTGKTSAIKLMVQAIGCLNLNFDTLAPCGTCFNCRHKNHILGNEGWVEIADVLGESEAPTPIRYLYLPVECPRLTVGDLDELIAKVRYDDGNLKIIYLDEVHRLGRNFNDEKFLGVLEDSSAIWIASSANLQRDPGDKPSALDKMFCNRFSFRINTEKPSIEELMIWLADRCEEFGLAVEAPEETLRELSLRSMRVPGLALHVLNRAHKSRSRELTRQLLEEHDFSFEIDS